MLQRWRGTIGEKTGGNGRIEKEEGEIQLHSYAKIKRDDKEKTERMEATSFVRPGLISQPQQPPHPTDEALPQAQEHPRDHHHEPHIPHKTDKKPLQC